MIVTATLADALRNYKYLLTYLRRTTNPEEWATHGDWNKLEAIGDTALTEYDRVVAEREAYAKTIQLAREQYVNDDINIDDDAMVSVGDEGAWVEAWVYVPIED